MRYYMGVYWESTVETKSEKKKFQVYLSRVSHTEIIFSVN